METEVTATAVGITVIAAVVVRASVIRGTVMEIVLTALRTTDIDMVDGIMAMVTSMDVSAVAMVVHLVNAIRINGG